MSQTYFNGENPGAINGSNVAGENITPTQEVGNNNEPKTAAVQKRPKIEMPKKLEFRNTIQTEMLTVKDLGQIVNTLFKAALEDYEGCIIEPAMGGSNITSIYLRMKNGPDVVPIGVNNNNINPSIVEKLYSMNNRVQSTRRFDLSQRAMDLISDFIADQFIERSPNGMVKKDEAGRMKIKWKDLISEHMRPSNGLNTVYIKVDGIDITKILKEVYGKGNKEDGEEFFYKLDFVKPLSLNTNYVDMANCDYLVTVQRLNNKELTKIMNKIGLISSYGDLPMIR